MKKRKVNALLAIVLSLTMMVGVAGCGKKQQLEAEIDPGTPVSEVQFPLKETAELSFIISAPATSTQDPNERVIFQRMEEQTNVHIDWTCFVTDQFSDKKNLALAQFGNLPDGLFNAGMSDYDLLRYAKQGIIIPLENLIDKYMPNLQAVFEKYPEYRTMCTAPDGHIYSFPWIEQLGSGKEAIQAIGDIPYINKKWLDYLGLEIPTTTDELEQVLLQFRDHADELEKEFSIEGAVIPMSFIINNGDQDPAILLNGFGEGYDKIGCFSGSAIELDDGRQLLIYTAVDQETLEDGTARDIQTQAVAVGDGKNYKKYEKNPVLTAKDLPEGASKVDFRDPKIWKEKDGYFYCVIGSRPADGSGQILLYKSADGFEWEFVSVLAENKKRYGKMWECPDFFELDGKHVLLTSPQDMLPEGLEFHNGNGTLCIIGEMDPETHTLKEETVQSVDYGMDYYAMQTLLAPDGRRIMIAWMQNWDTTAHRCNDSKWFAQMSLPREVSVKNGRLYQTPIKELDAMRKDRVEYNDVVIDNDAITLDKIEGRTIDMELVIRPEDKENVYKKFVLRFAQNEKFYTELSFRPDESVLKIDRKFSGTERALVHQRRCLVNGDANELKLRVILDRFSAEIFINDGEQVMSVVIFTEQEAKGISFFAEGAAKIDIVKYNLV